MLCLKCDCNIETLKKRWDERFDPARFAGGDEVMDTVFIAKRRDCKVFLIKKAMGTHDPFTAVFRGSLKTDGDYSVITGFFCKRVFDYVVCALFLAFVAYLRFTAETRGMPVNAMDILLLITAALCVLFLYVRKSVKNKYIDILTDIIKGETNNEKL